MIFLFLKYKNKFGANLFLYFYLKIKIFLFLLDKIFMSYFLKKFFPSKIPQESSIQIQTPIQKQQAKKRIQHVRGKAIQQLQSDAQYNTGVDNGPDIQKLKQKSTAALKALDVEGLTYAQIHNIVKMFQRQARKLSGIQIIKTTATQQSAIKQAQQPAKTQADRAAQQSAIKQAQRRAKAQADRAAQQSAIKQAQRRAKAQADRAAQALAIKQAQRQAKAQADRADRAAIKQAQRRANAQAQLHKIAQQRAKAQAGGGRPYQKQVTSKKCRVLILHWFDNPSDIEKFTRVFDLLLQKTNIDKDNLDLEVKKFNEFSEGDINTSDVIFFIAFGGFNIPPDNQNTIERLMKTYPKKKQRLLLLKQGLRASTVPTPKKLGDPLWIFYGLPLAVVDDSISVAGTEAKNENKKTIDAFNKIFTSCTRSQDIQSRQISGVQAPVPAKVQVQRAKALAIKQAQQAKVRAPPAIKQAQQRAKAQAAGGRPYQKQATSKKCRVLILHWFDNKSDMQKYMSVFELLLQKTNIDKDNLDLKVKKFNEFSEGDINTSDVIFFLSFVASRLDIPSKEPHDDVNTIETLMKTYPQKEQRLLLLRSGILASTIPIPENLGDPLWIFYGLPLAVVDDSTPVAGKTAKKENKKTIDAFNKIFTSCTRSPDI